MDVLWSGIAEVTELQLGSSSPGKVHSTNRVSNPRVSPVLR